LKLRKSLTPTNELNSAIGNTIIASSQGETFQEGMIQDSNDQQNDKSTKTTIATATSNGRTKPLIIDDQVGRRSRPIDASRRSMAFFRRKVGIAPRTFASQTFYLRDYVSHVTPIKKNKIRFLGINQAIVTIFYLPPADKFLKSSKVYCQARIFTRGAYY
jgi:hypothetical protein